MKRAIVEYGMGGCLLPTGDWQLASGNGGKLDTGQSDCQPDTANLIRLYLVMHGMDAAARSLTNMQQA
jgi:hypothetical protein